MKKSFLTLGLISLTTLAVVAFVSCKKASVAQQPEVLNETPDLSDKGDYSAKHGVNNDLAKLGRVLFYDKNLSLNNSTSCGSCHKQQFAFADNVRFNAGFNGLELDRNSPSIQGIKGFKDNLITNFINGKMVVDASKSIPTKDNQIPVRLFWDGRQTNVADMVLNPVTNHKEMNMPDFETLVKKLSSVSYYPSLFQKAYGDKTITKEKIAFAMESFLACLNTNDLSQTNQNVLPFSTFTISGVAFTTQEKLTPLEQQGLFLFHAKYNCAQCHRPSNSGFPGNGGGYGGVANQLTVVDFDGIVRNTNSALTEMVNIGLDEQTVDAGLGALTGRAGDEGLFKVPTLHNISLTAPYMHDGRYANLSEVLDHYSHNIKKNPNLSPLLKNADGTAKDMNINASEKIALIAFLNTLRDDDFLTSPMYSDPFKK